MASTFSLVFTAADGESPITSTKRSTALNLRNWFHKRAGGHSRAADTVECKAAQVRASAIVTAATVVNNNTIAINGTTFTATQKHARGTITPTLSGIDVDDTVTINTTGILTAKKHHSYGTVTITAAGVDVDDTVTLNGYAFTAKAAEDLEAGQFDTSGTDTAAATSLAACINASTDPLIDGIFEASSAAGVVLIRAVATGITTYTFVSSDAQLAVTGSGNLTAGTVPAANEFDFSGTTAQACTSLAAAINACTALSGIVTAWASATVVTVRAVTVGTGGNSIGLASSDAQLAVSAANLSGGAAVANNVFDFGGTDTETATDLARAINASTTALVNKHVTATSSGAAVTITAAIPGHAGNAVTVAGTVSTLVFTDSVTRLAGGTETLTTHTY
jgi:hypothetical protein